MYETHSLLKYRIHILAIDDRSHRNGRGARVKMWFFLWQLMAPRLMLEQFASNRAWQSSSLVMNNLSFILVIPGRDGKKQAPYVHAMLKTRPSHIATTGCMAIIFRNGIHKMFNDNGSTVSSLAVPVRNNQYVLGNTSKKQFPTIQLASTLEWMWKHCQEQRGWMRISRCL